MSDCVFCGIVRGEVPSSIAYQDDLVTAFMDINPVNTGHVLVVPKQHAAYLADVDEETGGHLFKVSMRIAQAIRNSGVKCEGINLFLADGEAAFQEVFHTHLHVFPRFKGDSFKIDADWTVHPPRAELDDVAAKIRHAYESLYPSTSDSAH